MVAVAMKSRHLFLRRKATTNLGDTLKSWDNRASLVAQGLRAQLAMQGTAVPSMVLEDLVCRGAAKPMCHTTEPELEEPRAPTPEPMCHVHQSLHTLEPVLLNKRSPHSEKPLRLNYRVAPLTTTREGQHAAMKIQHSQKLKQTNINH